MKLSDAKSGDWVELRQWFRLSRPTKGHTDPLLLRLARKVNGRLVEDNASGREWWREADAEVLEHVPHRPGRDEGEGEDPLR